jgi:Mg-chelatase subunit ChlD
MNEFTSRFSTLLLAFAVGTASTSAIIYKVQADNAIEPIQISETISGKQKTLEMVFVLDTTGSMGGLIEGAKTKIWALSTT